MLLNSDFSSSPNCTKFPKAVRQTVTFSLQLCLNQYLVEEKKSNFQAMLEMSEWKLCQKDFWKNDRWVVFSTQVMSIMTGISQCFPKDVRNYKMTLSLCHIQQQKLSKKVQQTSVEQLPEYTPQFVVFRSDSQSSYQHFSKIHFNLDFKSIFK